MKISKLICTLIAVTFFFTAGISSIAFCQINAETENGRIVNPQVLRRLSPQPEPPDREINFSRSTDKRSVIHRVEPPGAQVVNNSGVSIYKVRVGRVEFSRHLSSCFDGCSTGFKDVKKGKNRVYVKIRSTSAWKEIGTVGKFEVEKHYAVNILLKGETLCALLALRHQTDSTYNDDRTKEAIDRSCTSMEEPRFRRWDPRD